MKSVLRMCLDWRVVAGLGAVAIGVWLFAPQYIFGALPLLLVIACPLSMVVMALMMRGSLDGEIKLSAPDRLAALEREHAQLESEIAQARAERAGAAGAVQPREA